MWLRNSSPSLWYRSKSGSRRHSLNFVCTREHFRNTSYARTMIV
jgi:hypothetical protein